MHSDEVELIASRVGRIGHMHLNRPKALNSLSLDMIGTMDEALEDWREDDAVEAVVVTGAGDRAFCAGGDVKALYFDGKQHNIGRDDVLTSDFFRKEYTLNHKIASYPKPYVSYLDGLTMGGGVGISIMGSHRIASQHMKLAMPETAIGFFPDVGGSYFMSRLGPLGLMLSLTGEPLDYAASLQLGIATHFVPRDMGRDLVQQMGRNGVEPTLRSMSQTLPQSTTLPALQTLANRCFVGDSVEEVFVQLEQACSDRHLGELAQKRLNTLQRRSPTSMKVTFEQMARGKHMSLRDCLMMEYRISQACMAGHDFYEGVRAALVDKDHAPQWSPAALDQVDHELVAAHFKELGKRELKLAR